MYNNLKKSLYQYILFNLTYISCVYLTFVSIQSHQNIDITFSWILLQITIIMVLMASEFFVIWSLCNIERYWFRLIIALTINVLLLSMTVLFVEGQEVLKSIYFHSQAPEISIFHRYTHLSLFLSTCVGCLPIKLQDVHEE